MSQEIEELRFEMVRLAMEKNDFLDEGVIRLSQQLDQLIVRYHIDEQSQRNYVNVA